jgi:hypothetical protein
LLPAGDVVCACGGTLLRRAGRRLSALRPLLSDSWFE